MTLASLQPEAEASAAPWWLRLPDDFHRQRDGTELDRNHRLKVHGTAAIDRVVRSMLGTVLTVSSIPSMLAPGRMREQLERLKFYEKLAEAGDADRSFPAPPRDIHMSSLKPKHTAFSPGIPYRLLRFDSPFQPLNPDLRESYARHLRNREACAQHWYHRDGPRPTLIVVHGFVIDPYWINAQMFSLRWFYEHGYDILLYTLPFHGKRGGPTDWFSGQRLFADGLPQFNEGMAHAIHDLRVFMNYLQNQGVEQMGITGLSLGGYTSALAASVDPRLAFCIPNSPAVSPIDLMLEWFPTNVAFGGVLKFHGVPIRTMRAGLASSNALSYKLRIDASRVLIIGGAGDRFTPPRHVRLLHEHWPGSQLHWFPGNHLLHLQQADYLRKMKRFMDRHIGRRGV